MNSKEIYNPSTVAKLHKLKAKADKLTSTSKLLFRDNTCLENCAGCCMKFSLVYWGPRWEKFKELHPEEVANFKPLDFNGTEVWEDTQDDNNDYYCKHLDKSNGRCKLHFTQKPIHCEMEPISFSDGVLTKRPFKEAHLMKTLDGQGAPCYMSPVDNKVREEDVSLLIELNTLLKSRGLECQINNLKLNKTKVRGD